LHAAQYRAEEADHAEILDDVDRLDDKFLQNRRHREQYGAAEAKHVTDELILACNKTRNVKILTPHETFARAPIIAYSRSASDCDYP